MFFFTQYIKIFLLFVVATGQKIPYNEDSTNSTRRLLMKQRFKKLLISVIIAIVLLGIIPGRLIHATGVDTPVEKTSGSTSDAAESEYLDSYYLPIQSNETPNWPEGPAVEAGAAIVMDADTGAILYEKNIDTQLYPASITKIMTILIALEHGNLSDIIPFSDEAVNSLDPESSRVGLTPGEEITLEDALNGLMLASGNEIANAIAERYGGTIQGFVDLMNEKAADLGCQHTHFMNPHGLHDEEHYVSAYDMAIICKTALSNSQFLKFAGNKFHTIPATNLVNEERSFMNSHKMLIDDTQFTYPWCVGGKTGFTDEALNTLVTFSKKDGINLICVTLLVNGSERNYKATTSLLNYVYDNFSLVSISENDMTLQQPLYEQLMSEMYSLQGGKPLKSITGRDVLLIPNTITFNDLTYTLTFDSQIPEVNPVRSYFYNGRFLGSTTAHYTLPYEAQLDADLAKEEARAAAEALSISVNESNNTNASTNLETEVVLETNVNEVDTNNQLLNFLYSIKNNQLYQLIAVASIIGFILLIIIILMLVKNHSVQKRRAAKRKEEE